MAIHSHTPLSSPRVYAMAQIKAQVWLFGEGDISGADQILFFVESQYHHYISHLTDERTVTVDVCIYAIQNAVVIDCQYHISL